MFFWSMYSLREMDRRLILTLIVTLAVQAALAQGKNRFSLWFCYFSLHVLCCAAKPRKALGRRLTSYVLQERDTLQTLDLYL